MKVSCTFVDQFWHGGATMGQKHIKHIGVKTYETIGWEKKVGIWKSSKDIIKGKEVVKSIRKDTGEHHQAVPSSLLMKWHFIIYICWLMQMKWQLHTTTMFAIVCLCRLSCPQHSKPVVSGYLRQCLMILTVSSDWTHSPDLNQPTWPTSAQVIVYPLAVKNGNGKASIHRWFSQQRLHLSWLFAMFGYQRVL